MCTAGGSKGFSIFAIRAIDASTKFLVMQRKQIVNYIFFEYFVILGKFYILQLNSQCVKENDQYAISFISTKKFK